MQKQKSQVPTIQEIYQQKKLDIILNKTALDLVTFSVIGYTIGFGSSLFFKNKAAIRNLFAGVGGSYALVLNVRNFNKV